MLTASVPGNGFTYSGSVTTASTVDNTTIDDISIFGVETKDITTTGAIISFNYAGTGALSVTLTGGSLIGATYSPVSTG
jgi:hypothetical protein